MEAAEAAAAAVAYTSEVVSRGQVGRWERSGPAEAAADRAGRVNAPVYRRFIKESIAVFFSGRLMCLFGAFIVRLTLY